MPTVATYFCRIDGKPIVYTGTGRIPTTCSPECRRAARAEDARARRIGRPPAPTIEPYTADDVARIRGVLADSAAEHAAAYDDRARGIATFVDVFADAAPGDRLGDLGFGAVGPGRLGGTTWPADGTARTRAREAARDAQRMREACIADAIRDARSDALLLGVFELDDAALDAARARGLAKADRILAALALA